MQATAVPGTVEPMTLLARLLSTGPVRRLLLRSLAVLALRRAAVPLARRVGARRLLRLAWHVARR